jgi:hypothetical protein
MRALSASLPTPSRTLLLLLAPPLHPRPRSFHEIRTPFHSVSLGLESLRDHHTMGAADFDEVLQSERGGQGHGWRRLPALSCQR